MPLNILYIIHKRLNSDSWARPRPSRFGLRQKFFPSQIGGQYFKVGYFSRTHCLMVVTGSTLLC